MYFTPRKNSIFLGFYFSCLNLIQTFVSSDDSYETIIGELRNANEPIYFNIYEFTNPFLCDELVRAPHRNVSVNIFLEGSPIEVYLFIFIHGLFYGYSNVEMRPIGDWLNLVLNLWFMYINEINVK